MSATVNVAQLTAALKILSTMNVKGMIEAFEGQDTATKIIQGEIALDDAAEIVGVFIPPVAVIANDVKVAITVEEVALPLVEWLAKQPAQPVPAGKINVFGVLMDDPNYVPPARPSARVPSPGPFEDLEEAAFEFGRDLDLKI